MLHSNSFYFDLRIVRNAISYILTTVMISFSACRKSLEPETPITGLTGENVYSSDNTAVAAVTGIYQRMLNANDELSGGSSGISMKLGLISDELKLFYPDLSLSQFYTNSLNANNSSVINTWSYYYRYIYHCNAAMDGLTNSTSLSGKIKNQLIGEVKFTRGLLYFYLVNLFGDVPLILTTDYRKNIVSSRSPSSEIYAYIIEELKEAKGLLSEDYLTPQGNPTTERVRPNKLAVMGLLARIYLFTGDWANAKMEATFLIDNPQLKLESDLNNVFLRTSNEAILQLQPTANSFNTYDGYTFILDDNFNSVSPAAISQNLLESFEDQDKRKADWVGNFNGYYFPFKYKIKGGTPGLELSEYVMVLRLAEQYLIRAEAEAHLGEFILAAADLNIIRNRAGLEEYAGPLHEEALIKSILDERRIELFTEWGHRWLDIKRSGIVDNVMSVVSPQKGGSWNSNWKLLPIPQSEILNAPNITQNNGY